MQRPQDLAELIQKYQSGTASPEELSRLHEWYRSFDDSQAVVSSGEELDEQQLGERIKARLAVTIGNDYQEPVTAKRSRLKPLAIGAVILLLLTSGLYLLLSSRSNNRDNPQPVAVEAVPTNDIDPGGNKAVLTLADGSVILLDSATNGLLSTQGNIKVEKLANGLLAYNVNGKILTENDDAFYNTITTPRGGQYQVTLSDGTKVWLNAASSIRFPVLFTGTERKVEITGEAYFEVARNERIPFKVKAASAAVEVLGTHFNVNAYDDEATIKTTLLEGKVKVALNSGMSQAGNYLLPGQQASITKSGAISIFNNADIEEVMAWKNGRFQFKSADLRSILRQIARWYDVEVVYKGNVDLHFTGQLTRNDKVSKVFEKLELTGEVQFRVEGRKIIVSR
jgi:transmembrane sensor